VSQLRVSAAGQQDFYLNVLSFDSPITGEMNSGQSRSAIQYYPIKAYQPELQCEVIFPSEALWQAWQTWSRQNMVNAQVSGATNGACTLNWPERNINNWTGIIASAKAGGMKFNYTPRTTISFMLVVSLVSNAGAFAQVLNAVASLTGGSASGAGTFGGVDNVLTPPSTTSTTSTAPALLGGSNNLLGGSGVGSLASNLNSVTSLTSLIPGVSSLTSILGSVTSLI
jgi:hypothetical protein